MIDIVRLPEIVFAFVDTGILEVTDGVVWAVMKIF